MSLVKVMVTGGSKHPTLLPWQIISIHEPDETFSSLFGGRVKPRLLEKFPPELIEGMELERCCVGEGRDTLDETELLLSVHEVTSMFGVYIKYFVTVREVENPVDPPRNAFDVLMHASVSLSYPAVPSRISARNRKDDLYNAVIDLFEQKNLVVPHSDANLSGKCLVKALCNVLWYIDGQHETLSARSCHIPEVFSPFQNYNKPELSKHRKRERVNLSEVELRGLSSDLFVLLLNSYWKRNEWSSFKEHVEALARSLVDYADYLSDKNKKMKNHHSQSLPTRQISENLSISFISASVNVPPLLSELNSALKNSQPFSIIEVSDFCPEGPREKYKYIQKVHESLCVPAALLTYSGGGNVGNISVIWKMPDVSDNQISACLPLIENFKQKIQIYHTRSMRKALFTKFGRIAPSIKPSVLRYFYRELTGDVSASRNAVQATIDSRIKQ